MVDWQNTKQHLKKHWGKYTTAAVLLLAYPASMFYKHITGDKYTEPPTSEPVVDPNSPEGFINGISDMTRGFRGDIEEMGDEFQGGVDNSLEALRIRTMQRYREIISEMLSSDSNDMQIRFTNAFDGFSEGLQEPNE